MLNDPSYFVWITQDRNQKLPGFRVFYNSLQQGHKSRSVFARKVITELILYRGIRRP